MLSFEDAYEKAGLRNRAVSLLLGNGFSIAAYPSFDYRRLLDVATFGKGLPADRIQSVFDAFNTADFEMVIHRLESVAEVLDLYGTARRTTIAVRSDARIVKRALTRALASIHPDRIGDVGDDRLDQCHDFIATFDEVFTTNYDLLLYWAVNRKERSHCDDGFRRVGRQLLHTKPDQQNVSWLHGAAHLIEDLEAGESITVKHEWASGIPLVDQLRADLEEGRLPLIVLEGAWQQKLRKINASPYLSNALRLFRASGGALMTYGFSFSENDSHILRAIENSDITRLFVGLYGKEDSGSNPDTIGKAHSIGAATGDRIKVRFWDTATAPVW